MRLRFWVLLGVFLAGSAPAQAEDWLRLEFMGVRATAGTLMPGVTLTTPTLLFDPIHLYWTTFEAGYAENRAGEPYHSTHLYSVDFAFLLGSSLGGQIRLGPERRHEWRLGVFLGGLLVFGGLDNGEGKELSGRGGFAMGPELVYLYHFYSHLAIQAGFQSAFLIPSAAESDNGFPLVHHAVAFVGLAF